MKRGKYLLYAFFAALLLTVSSCTDDNKKQEGVTTMTLPSSDFGSSLADVQQSETQRGFTVSKTDSCHLTLAKTENGTELKYTYSFDPTTGEFRYAKGSYADDAQLAVLVKQIEKDGYSLQTSANDVAFYANATQNNIIVNKAKKEFFAIPASDDALAWGRLSYLRESDKAGLIVPYLGKYASVELMELCVQYNGNTLDVTNTKADRGVYVYKVAGNGNGYTQVKYWFDVATKSKLEEAAIYFDADKRPTTALVEKYMNYLGLQYTSMTDESDGSSIYFNYEKKYVAYVLMNKPDDATQAFTPNIHFTFSDLTGQVPPATVDVPEPIVDFGTMTLDEAVEQYKQKPYFTGTEDDGFGGALGIYVTTSSPDFPKILLMEDGGKYIAAILVPDDVKALRSPSLKTWLSDKGYTYDASASVLPTYVRSDNKVMAQFDLDGMFTGVPCLAFQPVE